MTLIVWIVIYSYALIRFIAVFWCVGLLIIAMLCCIVLRSFIYMV